MSRGIPISQVDAFTSQPFGGNPAGVCLLDGPADPLFDALREARRKLAAAAGVPPYVIFHDSTLREIAARKPASLAQLAEVQGVGTVKLQRYGQAMLNALSANG